MDLKKHIGVQKQITKDHKHTSTASAYYGKQPCENNGCKAHAYYLVGKTLLCGTHSRKYVDVRITLDKMPPIDSERQRLDKQKADLAMIQQAREANQNTQTIGRVIVSKLKMMQHPDDHPGFLKVFPNFKHQNRQDGFGCSSLSPMSLGPVHHGQPGLPDAKNIENFHQGSKCFQEEVDSSGEPSQVYTQNRLKFYLDSTPHRHKFQGTTNSKNKNIPLYFVWVDKQAKIHKLDYVTSRQFYCNFYERLASTQDDLKKLRTMRANGTNLQIVGYDGRSIGATLEDIEKEYLNADLPFGHELVLYTLLVVDDPLLYPWRKYKTFDF
jgi:hypothetical protein